MALFTCKVVGIKQLPELKNCEVQQMMLYYDNPTSLHIAFTQEVILLRLIVILCEKGF